MRQFSNWRYNYWKTFVSLKQDIVSNPSMFISKIKYMACHSETWAADIITKNNGAFGNNFLTFVQRQVLRMDTWKQLPPPCWTLWRRQQWDLHSAKLGWASSCSSQAQQNCSAAWRSLHHTGVANTGNNATAGLPLKMPGACLIFATRGTLLPTVWGVKILS